MGVPPPPPGDLSSSCSAELGNRVPRPDIGGKVGFMGDSDLKECTSGGLRLEPPGSKRNSVYFQGILINLIFAPPGGPQKAEF